MENPNIYKQVFNYNAFKGKEIVIVTNFKEMKIFYIGMENLLANLDLLNYNDETIKILYKYLYPYSLKDGLTFDNFFWNYFVLFNQYFDYFRLFLQNQQGSIISKRDIDYFKLFLEKTTYILTYLEENIKPCILKDKLYHLENLKQGQFNYIHYNTDFDTYSMNPSYFNDIRITLLELANSKKYLFNLIDINISVHNLNIDYYSDYENYYN